MIKCNAINRDELYFMEDNLHSLISEFSKEQAYEGYVDEKLKHIESGCRYIRALFKSGNNQ